MQAGATQAGAMQAGQREASGSPKKGEVDKLSKENFNLKLRIFYLEERLAKLRKGGETDESLQQEILEHKVLLEEKQQELDDRNMLLVKARNAIEGLHTDLALCRAELEESRSQSVSPEALREKSIEVDSLRNRLREAEERDRARMEDILLLNNQLRDLSEAGQSQRGDVEAALAEARRLDKIVQSLEAKLQLTSSELEHKAKELEGALGDKERLQEELATARHKLVENARALGDQRAREAELLARVKEGSRDEVARFEAQARKLREVEQERDKCIREAAMAERKAEDLADRLDEATRGRAAAEEKRAQLERELAHERDLTSRKEQSMRAQGDMVRDEMRKELGSREMELRGQLAELKGKLTALEFARDEAYSRFSEEKAHNDELSAKLEALRKERDTREKELENVGVNSGQELAVARRRLEEESKQRKQLEEQLRQALSKCARREKDMRKQMQTWEAQIVGKLDDLLPRAGRAGGNGASGSRAILSDEDDMVDEVDEDFNLADDLRIERTEQNGGTRPAPRRIARDKRRGALPGARQVLGRLDGLRELKTVFSRSCHDLERRWQQQVQHFVVQLDRSETKMRGAEAKLEAFAASMRALSRHTTEHATTRQSELEERHARLAEQMLAERKAYEERLERFVDDKEALRADLLKARERAAQLDGEARQARVELEALRADKRRSDERLEKLNGQHGVLEQRARTLAGELEERADKVRELTRAQAHLSEQLQAAREALEQRDQRLAALETRAEQAAAKAKASDRRLRDTRDQLERSLQLDPQQQPPQLEGGSLFRAGSGLAGSPYSPRSYSPSRRAAQPQQDDFERTMWRQVEETERAIRSSSAQHKKAPATPVLGASAASSSSSSAATLLKAQLGSLEKSSDILSEVLVAAAELVERTEAMMSRSAFAAAPPAGDVQELLRKNARLAQDLHSVGQDVHALHRRILNTVGDLSRTGGASPASRTPTAPTPSAIYSRTTARRGPTSLTFATPEPSATQRRRAADATHGSMALSTVHRDMLGRLGRIKADLEETATQLNFSKLEDR